MSWRITKTASITNKTGCKPCKHLDVFKQKVQSDLL